MTEKHNPQKPVPVYRHCTPSSSDADYQLSYSRAQQLVRNGDASRINHNKALRLRRGFELEPAEPRECKFPSRALQAYRCLLLAEIAEIEAREGYSPSQKINARSRIIVHIDQLRVGHAGLAGCRCGESLEETESCKPQGVF
jgi:hypothetical protein